MKEKYPLIQEKIIFYDAYCVVCNKFINWVIDHDPIKEFKFSALDGEVAKSLRSKFPELKSVDSVVYFDGKKIAIKGQAVRAIINQLAQSKLFKFSLKFTPNFLLAFGYDLVAKNRYKVFGKLEVCPLLPPEWRDRFI